MRSGGGMNARQAMHPSARRAMQAMRAVKMQPKAMKPAAAAAMERGTMKAMRGKLERKRAEEEDESDESRSSESIGPPMKWTKLASSKKSKRGEKKLARVRSGESHGLGRQGLG